MTISQLNAQFKKYLFPFAKNFPLKICNPTKFQDKNTKFKNIRTNLCRVRNRIRIRSRVRIWPSEKSVADPKKIHSGSKTLHLRKTTKQDMAMAHKMKKGRPRRKYVWVWVGKIQLWIEDETGKYGAQAHNAICSHRFQKILFGTDEDIATGESNVTERLSDDTGEIEKV